MQGKGENMGVLNMRVAFREQKSNWGGLGPRYNTWSKQDRLN